MAISVVACEAFEFVGSASGPLPSGVAAGDIVFVMTADDSTPKNDVATSGYVTLYDETDDNPSSFVAYKVMGGTPDTSIAFDDEDYAGVFLVVRGVDGTTPIDNGSSVATAGSGSPNPPTHTTITNGALRVIVGFLDDDLVADTATPPSGYTNFAAANGAGATVMTASAIAATAGSADPSAFSTSTDAWHALHFALRPASGGGGGGKPTHFMHYERLRRAA